jgi:8-oxo-dGTP pyrophosphatase MutT (NUDIX family)
MSNVTTAHEQIQKIITSLASYKPYQVQHAPRRAAVAMILRVHPSSSFDASSHAGQNAARNMEEFLAQPFVQHPESKCEVLFMKRAENPKDLWSGHVAFPGGRNEGSETDLETCYREVQEEVGLDLRSSNYALLGQLDDRLIRRQGRPATSLRPFVFLQMCLTSPVVTLQVSEVSGLRWVSLDDLTASTRDVSATIAISLRRYLPSLSRIFQTDPQIRFSTLRLPAHVQDDLEHHQLDFVLWGITLEIVSDVLWIAGSERLFSEAFASDHRAIHWLLQHFAWRSEFPTRFQSPFYRWLHFAVRDPLLILIVPLLLVGAGMLGLLVRMLFWR